MWIVSRNRSALGLPSAFVSASVFALTVFTSSLVSAQTCPFDNGGSTLENEGLVLTRYALGLRGATMVANTSFAPGDAATIESNIACPSCGLRVTDDKDALNNPIFTVADATIISRKIAGFTGPALTNGIGSLGTGSRNTTAAVQSFLLAGCGATGGTVTSVATGTGLTGGPITAAGTVSLANGYILPQGCTPGQVPKSDGNGTWSCAPSPAIPSFAMRSCIVGPSTIAVILNCSDLTTGDSTLIQVGRDTAGTGVPDDPAGVTSSVLMCGNGARVVSASNPTVLINGVSVPLTCSRIR
jgi:hypothetical protein